MLWSEEVFKLIKRVFVKLFIPALLEESTKEVAMKRTMYELLVHQGGPGVQNLLKMCELSYQGSKAMPV